MQIHGLNKTTLLDYPEHVAATIFTGGCNFRCPFCHNVPLVTDISQSEEYTEQEVLSFLKKRSGVLEGVCITGGEPLIQNGIEDFIKSIELLLKKLENKGSKEIGEKIRAEIYGSGSQEDYLKQLIKELHLNDRISIKGRIENRFVPDVLQSCDVFCAASKLDSESFGVAVVEAMAMKVPVVVTAVDGFKEVVVDGETGFVVPKGDIEVMAQKLEELILDKEKRMYMGQNGRQRVETLYDWEKNVDIMETLYVELRG